MGGRTSSLKSRDGKLNNRVLSASRDPDRFPAGSLHFPLEEHASCPAVQMTKKKKPSEEGLSGKNTAERADDDKREGSGVHSALVALETNEQKQNTNRQENKRCATGGELQTGLVIDFEDKVSASLTRSRSQQISLRWS